MNVAYLISAEEDPLTDISALSKVPAIMKSDQLEFGPVRR
jgi:hypothetical protein